MYWSESVLFASRYTKRLWIDLKNDSCVDGVAGPGCVAEPRCCDWDVGLAAVLLLITLDAEAFDAGEGAFSLFPWSAVLAFLEPMTAGVGAAESDEDFDGLEGSCLLLLAEAASPEAFR